MKTCCSCEVEKDILSFSPSKQNKDGLKGRCKLCTNVSAKNKRQLGISGDKERSAKYRAKNPEKRLATTAKYRANNPLFIRAASSRYSKFEKGKKTKRRLDLERRKREKTQSLKGARIDWSKIRAQIKELELLTGIKYCADHIMPLKGKNISGLHVPWNIQIVPYLYNASKGNRV